MIYFFKKIFLIFLMFFITSIAVASDPLPSWNNTTVKKEIFTFIQNTVNVKSPDFSPVNDRIVTIDNDGTLWVEKPMYAQVVFAFDRIKAMAPNHPEWKNEAPFNSILNNDKNAMAHFSQKDVEKIMMITHSDITVDAFQMIVKQWLSTAKNPYFKQPYPMLVYKPMLELIRYLKANHFQVYIVTGGGQEFVRSFAEKTYGIAPDHIIGSAGKTQFVFQHGKFVLLKTGKPELIDDHAGKPEAIQLFIGKKPIIAIGNSDGDQQMLEWTDSNVKPHLCILIHHDDAAREFKYDDQSSIGRFSNSLFKEATHYHWIIVSMKRDWKKIFSFKFPAH